MPPDSGKEPIGHLISAAVRGPSTLGRSEKLATRTEGISKQCSDGEEEEEDVLSHSQSVSESGSEMLGLHPAEPLDPAGLESNIAFVIGPNLPCGYDVEHFSLSDLVKYIQPYCDASGVLCLGTDTDSAGSVIEVQVIQDDDLQLPMVLGEDGEYRMEAIGVNGKVLVAGEESVMTKVSDPENLPQASKPEEAFLGPLVHQGDPPVTLRRRGRPRKTAKRAETLVSGAPRDISERPGAHCGLQTRLQRAADKRRASREAPSPQAGGKQEPAALTLQEFTLLADQMEEVELGEQRMQIRGRAAARRQRAAGRGPKKLPSPEIRAAGRDCSFANAEGWSMEPHLWSADIPAKPATGREESPGNILATTFPMADPALPFPIADPAPRSPMADPAPTADPALTASPATTSPMTDPALTFPIADPAPRSRAASPATTSQMTDPALTSRAANPVPRSPMADPAPTSPMTDLAPRFPTTDPAPTFPTTDPVPRSPMADPAPMTDPAPTFPTTDPVLTASPATTFPTTDPAPMTDPALTSRAANLVPRSPMADPAPTADPSPPFPTADPSPPFPTADPSPPFPTADLATTFPTADPAPLDPTTGPAPTADPATTFPTADPAPTSPFPVCAGLSPVVSETTNNEHKLRPISLQQYRLRHQQRKPDRVPSALAKPRNAWPIVPIQSIVHGELSVLPLQPTGHMLNPQSQGHHGKPLAPPTRTLSPPILPQPIQTLAPPQIPAAPSQWPIPPAPILVPSHCVTQAQLCRIQPSTKQEVAICAMLQGELTSTAETRILSEQSQPAHTPFVQPTAAPSPPLIQGDPECPITIPAATAVGMCSAVKEEQIPNQQTDLLQAEADQTSTVQTLPVKCASEQLLQLSRATVVQDEIDPGARSSVEERTAEDILKGIEAADLMSLLEKFEVTAVSEKLRPGNSNGSEEDRKLFDYIFGTELASTAGLTPPATPPQQIWTSVAAVGFLGKRRLQGTAEPLSGSPIRTVKLIEPKPLTQNNRSKCLSNESLLPPETPLTASLGFGDHAYCLPRVSSQPSSHICQPVMAHPDVACRWNVKRQASITIKPITWWNGQLWSPTHRVLTAEQQQVSDPGSDESISDLQETLWEDGVSSNTLPTGTASVEPGRSCSQAVDRMNVGCDTALKLNGGGRVTLSPCRNGEAEGDKPFDSPHHCSRTRTSPRYRRQRYSSSSSSTSRSRSHSPVRKRRRYCKRRSRHSRHSSRSDSRSSSRSRSCSRSHSGSDSGSRSRSSQRHSIQMSCFTDVYDSYSEEPQRRCSRHESRNRRRELAIEERRVVYVGKIRNGMMCEELRRRFEVFGKIEDCNIYFRNEGDNYGFVTFRYTCDAFAAIENGQTLRQPDELPFDLCFGGRRQFCKSNYADLDSSQANFSSYSTKSKFDSLDFDTLLKQAKRSLRR